MHDEDFVTWLNDDPQGQALRDDPVVRDKVAELWIEAQVCRLMTMRSMWIIVRGEDLRYEAVAAEKVWAPEHGVRSSEAICQMLGPYGQLLSTSSYAVERGRFSHNTHAELSDVHASHSGGGLASGTRPRCGRSSNPARTRPLHRLRGKDSFQWMRQKKRCW